MGILQGKTAVVTGANRGIGRAVVERFANEGAKIWACARKSNSEFERDMSELAEKYNTEIIPLYFDIATETEIKEAVKQIYKTKENVDILVNVAGVVNATLFQMTPMHEIRDVFDTNFFGPICLTQYIIKLMSRQKSGSVINVASISGIDVNPTNCTYGSSKAALIHFSKILASEVGKIGIRVNAVAPGPTETDMIKTVQDVVGSDHLLERCAMERCAMGRCAMPREVADTIVYLASDYSSFINGQVIRVDGGSK